MTKTQETCENCGRPIGNLETPRVHQSHVVCVACWQTLQPVVPNYATPSPARAASTQTVQLTGKAWKVQMLLSALLAIVGGSVIAIEMNKQRPGELAGLGVLALIAGILWFAFARIGAWWFHG